MVFKFRDDVYKNIIPPIKGNPPPYCSCARGTTLTTKTGDFFSF